jgi:hypothetical protein
VQEKAFRALVSIVLILGLLGVGYALPRIDCARERCQSSESCIHHFGDKSPYGCYPATCCNETRFVCCNVEQGLQGLKGPAAPTSSGADKIDWDNYTIRSTNFFLSKPLPSRFVGLVYFQPNASSRPLYLHNESLLF